MGEALEEFGVDQLPEDPVLLFAAEFRTIAVRLHLGLQPPPRLHVLNVEVLDGYRPAIGVVEHAEDLPQRGLLRPDEVAGVEYLVEVLFSETESSELEQRVAFEVVAERVEVGDEVADVAVGEDQARHLGLIGGAFRCHRPRRAVGEVEPRKEQLPLCVHGVGI